MKNNTFEEIWAKLKSCKRVAISLHYGPDGDSLGSCTAMKYVLERDFGAEVSLVSYDAVEENQKQMPFTKEVQFGTDISDLSLGDFDAVVCIDSANPGMISSKQRRTFLFSKDIFVVQLDHHPTNTYYGSLNYVDSEMPSACSLLVEFFKHMKVKFDAELSKRLLLGICTDTGFFAYGNNPLVALKEAVFLIEHGVDYYHEISQPIRFNESLETKRLFAILINNLKIDEKRHFAYSHVSLEETRKLGLNVSELRGGIRALSDIKEIDFVFTLTETEEYIKGSFRSNKNVDVSLFAQALGGGGHKPAAAFQLPKMSLKEAEKRVLEAIDKVGIQRY